MSEVVLLKAGDKFQELTAVRKTETSQVWVFRCDCGREVTLPAREVVGGCRSHCGHCKTMMGRWGENDPKKLGEDIRDKLNLVSAMSKINGDRLRKKDERYNKAHENGMTIAEMNKKALEEGLTYGEYVRKYGL